MASPGTLDTLTPNFYFPAQLCYDTVCKNSEVLWISSFLVAPAEASLVVIPHELGIHDPGLYFRPDPKTPWKLILTYEDMCGLAAPAATLKVIVKAATTQVVQAPDYLFLDAFQLPLGTPVTASTNGIYCWVSPAALATARQPLQDMFGTPLGTDSFLLG
jgi:hypothetical protein